MTLPKIPLELPAPAQTRAGGFGFFDVAVDVSEQFVIQGADRIPSGGAAWDAELRLPTWDPTHLRTITDEDLSSVVDESGGSRLDVADEGLARRLGLADGADPDSIPDCLGEADPFAYYLRREATNLEMADQQALMEAALSRVAELAFATRLIARLEALDVAAAGTSGRQAPAPDAIAIADDALLNAGVMGGVIHVPAYLGARVKADLGPEMLTMNGNRLHLYPSTALAGGTPKVYASPTVFYARRSQVVVVQGVDDGTDQPLFERNDEMAEGRLYGVVGFDDVVISIETDTIADITTAA